MMRRSCGRSGWRRITRRRAKRRGVGSGPAPPVSTWKVGDAVSEEQMKLLIGQGRHTRAGEPDAPVRGWAGSGRAFPIFGSTSLREMTARAFSGYNSNQGLVWNHPIPAEERARIRPADRSGYVRAVRAGGPGPCLLSRGRGPTWWEKGAADRHAGGDRSGVASRSAPVLLGGFTLPATHAELLALFPPEGLDRGPRRPRPGPRRCLGRRAHRPVGSERPAAVDARHRAQGAPHPGAQSGRRARSAAVHRRVGRVGRACAHELLLVGPR